MTAAKKKIGCLWTTSVSPADRKIAVVARQKAEETADQLALDCQMGEIAGKTQNFLGPTAAAYQRYRNQLTAKEQS